MTPVAGHALPQVDLDHVFSGVGALWERLRGQQIFLAGGTGFVGKWLLESLLNANRELDLRCRITVLSRHPEVFITGYPHLNDGSTVTFVSGDVRDFDFPKGHYAFVINAATDVTAPGSSLETFATCVEGTRRLLDFARQASATDFLLISSGAVYGRQPASLATMPETYIGSPDPLDPKSAYGEGKHCSEWLASAYAVEYGLSAKIARCFAFVGPYLPLDKHFAIGNFIRDALAGRAIVIQGDGTPYRSYLYAADLAIWLWTILLAAPSRVAYNVGGDEIISIAELARRVNAVIGSTAEVKVLTSPDPGKMAERYVPDVRKAETELGLKNWISLDQAILRTARWNQSQSR